MKIRKLITMFAIALCMMLPILMLTGCGADSKAYIWGKSFNYQRVVVDNLGGFGGENGTVIGTLLRNEFNKSNLDLKNVTINGITTDLSSAENLDANAFVSLLLEQAKNFFANTSTGKATFEFSSKEDKNVKINGTTYNLIEDTAPESYKMIDNDGGNNTIGYVSEVMPTRINNTDTTNCAFITINNEKLALYTSLSIDIPTINIVNDKSAFANYDENNNVISTSICLTYTSLFTLITE